MCGRFTLAADAEITAEFFGLEPIPELQPRYNIAPSQLIPVVGNRPKSGRGLASLTRGLVCSWENDPDRGFRPSTRGPRRCAANRCFAY